jgi:quinol monooxygenase YgiN
VMLSRRMAIRAAGVATLVGNVAGQGRGMMYRLIGRIKATSGKRRQLSAILIESSRDMPGRLSYVVATDPDDPDAIWVTEVWQNEADHKASLTLPVVKDAISKRAPAHCVV